MQLQFKVLPKAQFTLLRSFGRVSCPKSRHTYKTPKKTGKNTYGKEKKKSKLAKISVHHCFLNQIFGSIVLKKLSPQATSYSRQEPLFFALELSRFVEVSGVTRQVQKAPSNPWIHITGGFPKYGYPKPWFSPLIFG